MFALKRNRIRDLREEKGITQEKLAEIIGEETDNPKLNFRTIGNWENGITTTKMELCYVIALCNYFECDMDYLFGDQETKKKEYKFISEFTNLSTTAAEEIMKMSSAEQKLLDRFFTVQPGMIWLVKEMLKVASYIYQKGDIKINLPDGEARSETTKELEVTLNEYDARDMLSYTLQREIEKMIDSVLDDEEMQEIAHKEMIAYYRKHSFTYSPKGLPLSAMDLPRLSKDGTHLVSVDSDEWIPFCFFPATKRLPRFQEYPK